MTSNILTRASAYPRRSKALSLALVSILAVVLLVGLGGLRVSASASTSFDNVQVFVQTSQDLPYSYTLTVYNTSGVQVATYHSNFPAAAFELPGGTYLFTVQATYGPVNYPCIGCVSGPIPANSTTTNFTTTTTSYTKVTGSATPMAMSVKPLLLNDSGPMVPANSTAPTNSTTVTVIPVYRLAPSSNEYGYAIDQITGPSTITINTYNATTFPTTQVTVHVNYINGTAAQGAWVYASVVDDYYYYYGSNITSGAQTGADGTAILTVPQAPLLVTSYLTVPITLPQPNVTVIIGGQKVNVTLYYYPTSVTLEGQTLILPPQTSGDITLQYQPKQYYYPLPIKSPTSPILYTTANGTVTTITTTMSSTSSVNQNAVRDSIPPFALANVQAATLPKPSTLTTTVAAKRIGGESLLQVGGTVTIAAALATLTFVLVTVRGKSEPNVVSA
jgi:hypothetical protein